MNCIAVKEISLLKICKWGGDSCHIWHFLHLFKASIMFFDNSPFSVEIKITLNYNLLFNEKYVVLMSLSSTCILWALMYPVFTPPHWILFNYQFTKVKSKVIKYPIWSTIIYSGSWHYLQRPLMSIKVTLYMRVPQIFQEAGATFRF